MLRGKAKLVFPKICQNAANLLGWLNEYLTIKYWGVIKHDTNVAK